jgi:class 3 adenylate cyclase
MQIFFHRDEAILFMPPGENLYVANHVTMFIIIFLIVFYLKSENAWQENQLESRNKLIAAEKLKSDKLLLNILPVETAEELKETGVAVAKSYKMVTVFFSDFKNFTVFAQKLSPEKLVAEINYCFCAFDEIISKYKIEKIKTIGDSYMCAGGLPEENATNRLTWLPLHWKSRSLCRIIKRKSRKGMRIFLK